MNSIPRADEKGLDAAIVALRALPADPQRQPLQGACLGSAQAMQGKAASMPWNKLKFTEQGLDQIDAALALLKPEHGAVLVRGVPVSLQTRLVAAATFVAVPDGLFHSRADGRKLLAALRADPLLAAAPQAFRAEVAATEASLAEAAKVDTPMYAPATAAAARATTVRLTDLKKRYRVGDDWAEALKGVSLTAAAGEMVALTGPSGSGKSALLNLTGLIDLPDAGRCEIDGIAVDGLADAALTNLRRERVADGELIG